MYFRQGACQWFVSPAGFIVARVPRRNGSASGTNVPSDTAPSKTLDPHVSESIFAHICHTASGESSFRRCGTVFSRENGSALSLHFAPVIRCLILREQIGHNESFPMARTSRVRERKCPVSVCFTKAGIPRLLFCGQWICPTCRIKLARKWAKRVYNHIVNHQMRLDESDTEVHQSYFFITFTMRGNVRSVRAAFDILPKLWDTFRKRMQRRYHHFDYVAFVEGQPQRGGMPHFHIISSRPLPVKKGKKTEFTKRAVHDFAVKIGFGHQADMKPVASKEAAYYVSKYASKQSDETPRGFRRVRTSRTWHKLPKDPDKALLVKSRVESITDFIMRVADISHRAHEELYQEMITLWEEETGEVDLFSFHW